MNNFLVSKISLTFLLLLIFLAGVFALPKIILADDLEDIDREEIENYLQLPEEAVENLIHSLINFFTSEWISHMSSGYSTAEEMAVPTVLRGATRAQALNHLLVDAPAEVGFGIVNNSLKIARLFGIVDMSGLLGELEKQGIRKATNYGMRRLLENEIRLTPGAISFKYDLEKGGAKETIFQYIMIYKPIDAKRGKLAIRFYSTENLEAPKSQGSYGNEVGTYNELNHPLPPFVVDIQGEVENYQWVGQPSMKIDFPPEVPDLGIRPLSFWERQIWKPFVAQVKEVEVLITKVTGKSLGLGKKVSGLPRTIKNVWDAITAKLGKLSKFGGAQVAQRPEVIPAKEPEQVEPAEQTTERDDLEESAEVGNPQPSSLPEPSRQSNQPLQPKPLTAEEFQKNLGEVSKTIDSLSKRIIKPESSPSKSPSPSSSPLPFPSPNPKPSQSPQPPQAILCQKKSNDTPQRNKIIFNEIAWMGGLNSANDEWIELKNVSGKQIDLAGWRVLDKDGKIKINFDRGPTSANGFWLLERTNDGTVSDIVADLIYTGGLNNNNEALYLFDENCRLQDEVIASPDWSAGDNSSKRTMERKTDLTWQTSQNPGGTPKRENSSGYAVVFSGGGGGGGGASYSPPPQQVTQPEAEPQIALSFSSTTTADKEIEVQLSADNFKDASYDVKISIENGTATLSEISTSSASDWQNSNYYVQNHFSGKSYNGVFNLRIKSEYQNFRGEADLTAKIREHGKSNFVSVINKINIIALEQSQNQPPTAFFNFSPQNPFRAGGEILFDASSSTDADGVVLTYLWDFGDNATGAGATTSHAFLNPGTSTVALFIFDDKGATSSTSTVVEISTNSVSASAPTSPAAEYANHILITEVRAVGSEEFVEIYNPTSEATSMAGWYLSYFSENRDWNNPYLNKPFSEAPTTTIPAKSYFLVGFGDYNDFKMDWKANGRNLNNDSGAIGIFSGDPTATATSKIDVLGWGDPVVKEGTSTEPADDEKSFARKIATTSEGVLTYIDSDNNISDFEIQEPTPKVQNRHQFSDLDGDGIVDFYDSTTTIATTTELKAGEYKFKDLVIIQGGKLILNSSTTLDGFKGVKIAADNLLIDASSSISADGEGYLVNEGPSAGCGDGGAGYGGIGGDLGNFLGGGVYGSLEQPVDLGSGGGASRLVTDGSGGGAVWLKIEKILSNDGVISNNGENGQGREGGWWATGAGSGGSIYIETNIFSGSGKITANGGNADSAGAGSGGRIAVYYATSSFNGVIQAFGGRYYLGGADGGPGTIFLKQKNQNYGDLIIDNNGQSGTTELASVSSSFDLLSIINYSRLIFAGNLTAQNLQIKNNGVLETATASQIMINEDFIIEEESSLISPTQIFLVINVGNDIIIRNGSILNGNFNIQTGNLTLATSSLISANGKGYPTDQGPGTGRWSSSNIGGSYGGVGGNNIATSTYGSSTQPTDFGSGGRGSLPPSGAGGGAIYIVVNNDLIFEGSTSTISSNGAGGGGTWWDTGGGSGGSVYIKTNDLNGAGLISASGGGAGWAGAGGGGRIAIIYDSMDDFTGQILALGGEASGEDDGEAGTIYLQNPMEEGQLFTSGIFPEM